MEKTGLIKVEGHINYNTKRGYRLSRKYMHTRNEVIQKMQGNVFHNSLFKFSLLIKVICMKPSHGCFFITILRAVRGPEDSSDYI